jgi:hypothetical protein
MASKSSKPHLRARVSKDGAATARGRMLRDASQRSRARCGR